ncbi:hypothetical protein J437_LFUL010318 [Ladona fulva]|uniref:Selenoprotein S n=1 Tax=Ladona fulva TaxID=123851 RepID=A0A8K0KAC1_LADFU|nr:hypothetical protein J437_LFUL010318 [Ladona fulva]
MYLDVLKTMDPKVLEHETSNVHPESLDPTTPKIIINSISFVSDYGWYIIGLVICLLLLWTKKIKPAYVAWKKRMDEREYDAKYHKDPECFRARQETMEIARLRMQLELEKKAQEYLEKQKQVEEAKRQERIADWERHEKGLGYRSKIRNRHEDDQDQTKKPQTKPALRPEYNPLMGSGSSSGYRPPRRNVCSGGGCG